MRTGHAISEVSQQWPPPLPMQGTPCFLMMTLQPDKHTPAVRL